MASDEEDEELAALRFAALASMKSKQKPIVEEDEDLKALKEAALRTLEKTLVTPNVTGNIPLPTSIPPPSHLHQVQHLVQSNSPNYYSSQPPPSSQYGHSQYSHPPPNYQPVHNVQTNNMYHIRDNHRHRQHSHRGRPTKGPTSSVSGPMGNVTRGTTSMAGVGRSNTPPITGSRGGGSRGNHPRGLPPRANNLIVISPMPMKGEAPIGQQGGNGQTNDSLPKVNTSASKPVLLRPQDKWCSGTSDSNSLTASPSRPKASGKFSRFDTSSESEESESEDEAAPLNKSSDRASDSDARKSASDNDKKMSDSDSDTSSDAGSVKSIGNNSESSRSNNSDKGSKDSDDDENDNEDSDKGSEDSDKEEDSSDEEKFESDVNSGHKVVVRTKQESETEEEKLQRREADRLLEETMDRRQVLNTSSEKEDREPAKWTADNISVTVQSGTPPKTSFDLSHKLMHHRARVKEQNGNDLVPGDLSSKLTNRRNRQEADQNNSTPVSLMPNDFVNIKIQKSVEDTSEGQKPKLSHEDLQKFEARKRKFELSPVSSSKEGKKTISLKGIVPRSKKRQKDRHRSGSSSPVPKRYSRDLERYEKKKASKVRHKSGSKENKEQKISSNVEPLAKDRTDSRPRLKDRTDRKSLENKKNESDSNSSDESKSEACAQISDIESDDEEGRSWRKEANKSRLVFNKDRKSVRDTLDPVRFDQRHRRDYHGRPSRGGRFEDRRSRFNEPQIDVILPKYRRGGGRHRSVEVMGESDSDSDGPKLPSSVVLPCSKQHSEKSKQKEDADYEKEDSASSRDSTRCLSFKRSAEAGARKRMVVSSDTTRTKQSKGSRKVTTDLDSRNSLSLRTKSKSDDHSKRKAKFESRDRSPLLSVTLDPDKELPESSRSCSSIHERLGRQLNSSDTNVDRAKSKYDDRESRKKKKSEEEEHMSVQKGPDESSKADDDLEQRIQRIKEKNAAILKRQEEVRQDKERYG